MNSPVYIQEAANDVKSALTNEHDGSYDQALKLFIRAVETLLEGVKRDENKQRRQAVRQRVLEYISHGEVLKTKIASASTWQTRSSASLSPSVGSLLDANTSRSDSNQKASLVQSDDFSSPSLETHQYKVDKEDETESDLTNTTRTNDLKNAEAEAEYWAQQLQLKMDAINNRIQSYNIADEDDWSAYEEELARLSKEL